MTFVIKYLPMHSGHDPEGCWCELRGFPTYRMAAIYAYHHVLCRQCKKDLKINKDLKQKEMEGLTPGECLEYLWDISTCSCEWWIIKDDEDDE